MRARYECLSLGLFVRKHQAQILPVAIFLRKKQSARSTKQLSQEQHQRNDASEVHYIVSHIYFARDTLLFVFSHQGKSLYPDGSENVPILRLMFPYHNPISAFASLNPSINF
jgi:hypothetical protein